MLQEVSEFDLGGSAVHEHAAKCGLCCECSIIEAVGNEGSSGSVNPTAVLLDEAPSNGENNWEGKGES